MLLPGFQKALKRTASLLPLMPKAHPMYRGNPAITILRLFLWLMPAVFVPVAIFLGTALSNFLPVSACISLSLLLFVTATAGVGLFEQLLTFQEIRMLPPTFQAMGTPPSYSKGELVRWTGNFVLVQIILAPMILAATLCIFAVFASLLAHM
jgi:hypothetical protein